MCRDIGRIIGGFMANADILTRPVGDALVSSGASLGLIHDYLLVMRGAERAFSAIASCWPNAPIYTLLFDPARTAEFSSREVHTSYLQRLRVGQRGFRRLLPFFPHAVERLPVQEHDVIISSSSAFAHGVRPKEGATHICYCYTPFRYVYYERAQALAEIPFPFRPVMNRVLERIGRWDKTAAARVDHYIAISELTRQRIADCYGRDASVLHPPVDVDRFSPGDPQDYFLVVAELVRHKRVELALEAARRAGRRVKVVGAGPDLPRLKALYGETAEFLGRVPDSELNSLYSHARALIVPNVEEFGITIVEAQAAGRPVVAADGGGARETIVPESTGVLVPSGDTGALAEALRETDFDRFDVDALIANAARFSTHEFCSRLLAEVDRRIGAVRA
jgi:glycosyltransferase involved in cell wall biosynthesis